SFFHLKHQNSTARQVVDSASSPITSPQPSPLQGEGAATVSSTNETKPEIKPTVQPAKPIDPNAAMKASLAKFNDGNTTRFVVGLNDMNDVISANLTAQGFTKTNITFSSSTKIIPGGYRLSPEMTEAQIKYVLSQKPYMAWVVVKPGLRKEEIADV